MCNGIKIKVLNVSSKTENTFKKHGPSFETPFTILKSSPLPAGLKSKTESSEGQCFKARTINATVYMNFLHCDILESAFR